VIFLGEDLVLALGQHGYLVMLRKPVELQISPLGGEFAQNAEVVYRVVEPRAKNPIDEYPALLPRGGLVLNMGQSFFKIAAVLAVADIVGPDPLREHSIGIVGV
jgi:hypothetical protein